MLDPEPAGDLATWFVCRSSSPEHGPPTRAQATEFTVGNDITFLIDGAAYMARWLRCATDLAQLSGRRLLLHAGWTLTDVLLEGSNRADARLTTVLKKVRRSGAEVALRLSSHYASVNRVLVLSPLRAIGLLAYADSGFPTRFGSQHEKYTCFLSPRDWSLMLGSLDLSARRWDTPAHRKIEPRRPGLLAQQTHDFGVLLQGSAVPEVVNDFASQWELSATFSRQTSKRLPITKPRPIEFSGLTPPKIQLPGTCAVQVLRTRGGSYREDSWALNMVQERSIWAAYVNAITNARRYVYIEDQYFVPDLKGNTSAATSIPEDWNLAGLLCDAIARNVAVIAVLPGNADREQRLPSPKRELKAMRDAAVARLRVAGDRARNEPMIVTLHRGSSDVYVHSKLLIVDDALMICGSANVNLRSMTHDGEIALAIVDEADAFVGNARRALWAEHLGLSGSTTISDIDSGIVAFRVALTDDQSNVRRYRGVTPSPSRGSVIASHFRRAVEPFARGRQR